MRVHVPIVPWEILSVVGRWPSLSLENLRWGVGGGDFGSYGIGGG